MHIAEESHSSSVCSRARAYIDWMSEWARTEKKIWKIWGNRTISKPILTKPKSLAADGQRCYYIYYHYEAYHIVKCAVKSRKKVVAPLIYSFSYPHSHRTCTTTHMCSAMTTAPKQLQHPAAKNKTNSQQQQQHQKLIPCDSVCVCIFRSLFLYIHIIKRCVCTFFSLNLIHKFLSQISSDSTYAAWKFLFLKHRFFACFCLFVSNKMEIIESLSFWRHSLLSSAASSWYISNSFAASHAYTRSTWMNEKKKVNILM